MKLIDRRRLFDEFPLPWSRGASTTDGEPIYDANGELVMVIRAAEPSGEFDELMQRLIVELVNACLLVKSE